VLCFGIFGGKNREKGIFGYYYDISQWVGLDGSTKRELV